MLKRQNAKLDLFAKPKKLLVRQNAELDLSDFVKPRRNRRIPSASKLCTKNLARYQNQDYLPRIKARQTAIYWIL